MSRIGVFGGTFDPPHVGHLIVARDVVEALDLERLLLVPAGEPPHKPERATAPPDVRVRMLEAAVEGDARLRVSRIEVERSGPSYTVDTLRELARLHPGEELHLIIGVDQLREFSSWRQPEEVARLARLVVMAREGLDPADVAPGVGVAYETVRVTRVDLSSTSVRRRVREGRSVRYRVPEAVRRIIEDEELYVGKGAAREVGAGVTKR